MQEALHTLRDLQGVLGSFVLDEHGQLCARDMPTWIDDAALEEAGGRLARMRAAIASITQDVTFDGATARFGGHLLMLRPVGGGSLCVLCPSNVSMSTLQMGVSLVARRILTRSRASQPPAASQSEPTRYGDAPRYSEPPARYSEPPPAEAPAAAPARRFFRGRPVG